MQSPINRKWKCGYQEAEALLPKEGMAAMGYHAIFPS